MVEYDRYPGQELIAMAHLAAMESARREREEEAKRHILELEDIVLHQPNDFADWVCAKRAGYIILTRFRGPDWSQIRGQYPYIGYR